MASLRKLIHEGLGSGPTARRLDVSPGRVVQWCKEGVLDGIQTKLGWLIDPASIEALKQKRCGGAVVDGGEHVGTEPSGNRV